MDKVKWGRVEGWQEEEPHRRVPLLQDEGPWQQKGGIVEE